MGLSAARLYDHPDLVSLAAFVAGAQATPKPQADGVGLAFLVERLGALTGTPPAHLSGQTRLEEIGLEPGQAVALLDEVNQRFGIGLTAEAVGRCRDLAGAAALIDGPGEARRADHDMVA